jgi:hypothetical protein
MKRFLILICVSLTLCSCAQQAAKKVNLKLNYVSTNKVPVTDIDKVAQNSLLRTADSVDAELNRLAALKMSDQSSKLSKFLKKYTKKLPNMDRKFTLSWNGPMLPVIKQIAYYSKYNINILGKQPTIPTMIELNMKDQTLQDILLNIRFQILNTAKINVIPKSKSDLGTIDISYG